jgi:hypothetical protein
MTARTREQNGTTIIEMTAGGDLAEEALEVAEGEGGKDGRDDLRLVADHVNLEVPEVPERDLVDRGARDAVGVQELLRDEREAEHDAQHRSAAHLLGDRPADAHRDAHVEDGLADEPEEAVDASPELRDLDEGHGAVVEEGDGVYAVAEAEDEAADDDGRDERREDLCDGAHGLLERVGVGERGLLHLFLRGLADARDLGELVVEVLDVVADDDLELAGLGEAPLDRLQGLDAFHVSLARIGQGETHARHAVRHRRDVLLASHEVEHSLRVLRVLGHSLSSLSNTYANKYMTHILRTYLNK